MRFSDQTISEIKARVRVSEIVGKRVKLKKQGAEFVGLSPFKAENSPSFTVNDAKGFYHDFSSGKHGNVFDFLVETEGITFPEAVERCAKLAGIQLPDGGDRTRRATRRQGPAPAANGRDAQGDPPFDAAADAYDRGGSLERARDEAGNSEGKQATRPGARQITKTYDYTDAQGALIYQVCRIEWEDRGKRKKTFLQRRPDGEGHWIWGLSGGDFLRGRDGDWYQATDERVERWTSSERRAFDDNAQHGLYRLVELREEAAPGGLVVIAEGEKDVETLREWGFTATTNSGGARNWRPDMADAFAGLDVIVAVDNDDPGRDRGTILGKALRNIAKRVRVLDFKDAWPGAPKGADVTDWKSQAGGDATRLHELIGLLPDWKMPPFKSKFGGYPFEDIDVPGPEHEFVIDGWLTAGDKSVIGGASRSGKSFLAVDAAGCIATGLPFHGFNVLQPGLVIYQAGEGARGIKKRLRAWRQHFIPGHADRVPIYILQSRVDLYHPEGDTTALIEEIKGIAETYDVPLRAIFIDTLATASGGADENSGRDMGTVMANIDRLAQAVPGCHVCLVHHFNAAGTKLRGHTSIYANIDQVILVTKDEDTKIRTAVLDKQKDDEDGLKIRFELMQVELGRRQIDGRPITSCVTLPVGGKLELAIGGNVRDKTLNLSDSQTNVLRALKSALVSHGMAPPPELGLPQTIRTVVPYKRWMDAYRSIAADAEEPAVRQAMKRAGEKFLRLRVIGRMNPYVWLTGRAVADVQTDDDSHHLAGARAHAATAPDADQAELLADDFEDFGKK